ncbi:MAG: hypothetical protein RIC87_12595 [Kiloniellales bacterium]
MAPSTFVRWTQNDPDLAERYAHARDLLIDRYADEIIDIADDNSLDIEMTESGPRVNGEAIQRAKLRTDSRKWLLSKLRPEQYGERLRVNSKVEQRTITDDADSLTPGWIEEMVAPQREKEKAARAEQAEKLCSMGASDADLVAFFKIDEATLDEWYDEGGAFFEAVQRARRGAA